MNLEHQPEQGPALSIAPLPGLTDFLAALDEPAILTDPSGRLSLYNATAGQVLCLRTSSTGTPLVALLRAVPDLDEQDVALIEMHAVTARAGETILAVGRRQAPRRVVGTWSMLTMGTGPTGAPWLLHRLYLRKKEKLDASQVEFLANVSHELRTPLTAMAAASQVMLQEYQSIQPDQLGNMLALLVRNTRRLESLVSNLIDAAGLQNGKLQLRKSAATVQSLVRDAYDFVLPLLDAKHQRLETRTTGEPPVLTVDAKRIVGVLVNLLANANRYGVPNEPIQLLIANEGTFIRFTVRQKGPGIPKEEQALLFERFYRTSSGAAVSGGSGLGLAIVKDIVEMHGGTVGMHSKPGLTTAFWFTLPTDGSGGVA